MTTPPTTSASNWAKGQTVANLVTVRVLGNQAWLYNGGTAPVDFVADIVGYYAQWGDATQGAYYVPASPARILDTRTGVGAAGHIAKIAPGGTITLPVPTSVAGTVAATLNITATNATSTGYLTLYPHGKSKPLASSINYAAGATVANASIMPLGSGNSIDIYNGGKTAIDVIIDLSGTYFTYVP